MKATQISNEKGFSLLEVLVTVAIMGGLSLVMLQMNQNQLKQQKTIELKGEITDIYNIIRQNLDISSSCNATFIGLKPGFIVPNLRSSSDFSKPPFATIGNVKFQNYNVYIKEMKLLSRAEQLLVDKNPVPVVAETFIGTGLLKITFVKNIGEVSAANTSHEFFGGKEKVEYIPIFGYFYDYERVYTSNPTNQNFIDLCEQAAAADGVTCNIGSASQPCSITNMNTTVSQPDYVLSNGTAIFGGDCKYYKSTSPLQACITKR